MAEMLAVVAMIGAMAALAAPQFINLMRDRRVNRAAMAVAELYRSARTRALGRGAAVIVRWNATGGVAGTGIVEVREAIVKGAGGPLPATSCLTTDWTAADSSKPIGDFDLSGKTYELAAVSFFQSTTGGSAVPFSEICFSPRGRTWMRLAAAGSFAPLADVPRFEVKNTQTTVVRSVFIPPNGAARLAL